MILLLAETEDMLAAAAGRRLAASGHAVSRLSEGELTAGMPFALARRGCEVSGYLRTPGGEIALDALQGVLMRLPHRWLPADFDAPDQRFVFHETTAALFALFAALSCPVINRYGLWWWLRDESYPRQLLGELACRLQTTAGESRGGAAEPPVAVYAVGDRLLAAGEPDARGEQAVRWLSERSAALLAWRRSTGIALCRLDLQVGGAEDDPYLLGVDPLPSLAAEPPALVDRVAAAAVELLS